MNKNFKSHLLFIACTFSSVFCYGQTIDRWGNNLEGLPKSVLMSPTEYPLFPALRILEIKTKALSGSNFLNLNMAIQNQWNKELIDKQMEQLNESNTLGYYTEASISYYNYKHLLFNSESIFPYLKASYKKTAGLNMSKVAGGLFFKGNGIYKGIVVDIEPLAFKQVDYYSLVFGLDKMNTDKKQKFSIGLGLHYSNQLNALNTNNLSLYTDSIGLELIANGELLSRRASNGFGAGLEFSFIQKYQKNKLILTLSDLGVIYWPKIKTSTFKGNNYNFKGLEIINIFNSTKISDQIDTLENRYIQKDSNSLFDLLPFQAKIGFEHTLTYASKVYINVNYIYIPGYLPNVRIGYIKEFRPNSEFQELKMAWNIGIEYGGFGYLALYNRFQIALSQKTTLDFAFSGAENLLYSAIAKPKFSSSLGARFRI